MKRQTLLLLVILAVALMPAIYAQDTSPEKAEKTYFAVEMQGKIIGYSEESEGREKLDGSDMIVVRTRRSLKLSLLGSPMDVTEESKSFLDPESHKPLRIVYEAQTGPTGRKIECVFKEGSVHCKSYTGETLATEKDVDLGVDCLVIWGSGAIESFAASLEAGTPDAPAKPREFKCFIPAAMEVSDATAVFEKEEDIDLMGQKVAARRYLFTLKFMSTRVRYWIRKDTGKIARVDNETQQASIYETDPSIATMLKRAEITDAILVQTNEQIADVTSLTRMKLEVEITAPGEEVTVASLNVPGQKFEGAVEENFIKGVFELEPARYKGDGAPPFPPDFKGVESIAKYLEAEDDIESESAEIVELAKKLSAGAKDSWKAAVAFAKWVHEEIGYEIPGGGTALGTLKAKEAECGGHSRLHVALCRAVGIPARVVGGAMYVPAYGGVFGQHAWAEVYMGEKPGWIPIDATAGEIDYADAGHIRLGEMVAFRGKKVVILEYAPKVVHKLTKPEARPAPCEMGKTYTYHYLVDGTEIGTYAFSIDKQDKHAGQDAFFMTSKLEIVGGSAQGETVLTLDGRPLKYNLKGKGGGKDVEIDCAFGEKSVAVVITQGDVKTERTVQLPEDCLLFDNNNLGHFAMLISRFELKDGAEFTVKAFHPSSMSVLPLVVKVGKAQKLVVRGKEHEAFETEILIAGTKLNMFYTKQGMLVKDMEQNGKVVVECEWPGE
ncbi:MAG: transglutaminase-like domain-containing protein [Planctomycetota bacterium]|nr:transglutaminase-like domain-containing protein [Planctomycetota bacterium]